MGPRPSIKAWQNLALKKSRFLQRGLHRNHGIILNFSKFSIELRLGLLYRTCRIVMKFLRFKICRLLVVTRNFKLLVTLFLIHTKCSELVPA